MATTASEQKVLPKLLADSEQRRSARAAQIREQARQREAARAAAIAKPDPAEQRERDMIPFRAACDDGADPRIIAQLGRPLGLTPQGAAELAAKWREAEALESAIERDAGQAGALADRVALLKAGEVEAKRIVWDLEEPQRRLTKARETVANIANQIADVTRKQGDARQRRAALALLKQRYHELFATKPAPPEPCMTQHGPMGLDAAAVELFNAEHSGIPPFELRPGMHA